MKVKLYLLLFLIGNFLVYEAAHSINSDFEEMPSEEEISDYNPDSTSDEEFSDEELFIDDSKQQNNNKLNKPTKIPQKNTTFSRNDLIEHIKEINNISIENNLTNKETDWIKQTKKLKSIWDPTKEKTFYGLYSALDKIFKKDKKKDLEKTIHKLKRTCYVINNPKNKKKPASISTAPIRKNIKNPSLFSTKANSSDSSYFKLKIQENASINTTSYKKLNKKDNPLTMSLERTQIFFPKNTLNYNENDWDSLARTIKNDWDPDKKRTYLEFYFALRTIIKQNKDKKTKKTLEKIIEACERIKQSKKIIQNNEVNNTNLPNKKISIDNDDCFHIKTPDLNIFSNQSTIEIEEESFYPSKNAKFKKESLKRKRNEIETPNKKKCIDIDKIKKYILKGNNSLTQNDKANAIKYFKKVLILIQDESYPFYVIQAYIGLGDAKCNDFSIFQNDNTQIINIPSRNNNSSHWYIKALDVLKNLNNDAENITLRVQALMGLGLERHSNPNNIKNYTNYDSKMGAIAWLLEALDLLDIHYDAALRIKVLIALGEIQCTNGFYINKHTQYKETIKDAAWFLEALDLLEINDDINLRIKCLIGLGQIKYHNEINIEKYTKHNIDIGFFAWFFEALDLLGNDNNINHRIKVFLALSNAKYDDPGHITQYTGYNGNIGSIAWCLKALDLLENDIHNILHVKVLLALGNAKYCNATHITHYTGYDGKIGNPAWYLKALDILNNKNNVILRIKTLIGLGNAIYKDSYYIKKHTRYNPNLGQAAWYLEALSYLKNIDNIELHTQVHLGLGNTYNSEAHNRPKLAIEHYKKALALKPTYEQRHKALFNIGNAYIKLNEKQQAIDYFEQALRTNSSTMQRNIILQKINAIKYDAQFFNKNRRYS
ncbi:MAG: tetratricopeptide repeat protein [Alphaproteobacteria bacterium]|nr:tetratricopeptide repeat protein [Alphaproteobacteria bacterium]